MRERKLSKPIKPGRGSAPYPARVCFSIHFVREKPNFFPWQGRREKAGEGVLDILRDRFFPADAARGKKAALQQKCIEKQTPGPDVP